MQTTQQITKISCLTCTTRAGEQKTKLETASNAVARAYCPQPLMTLRHNPNFTSMERW